MNNSVLFFTQNRWAFGQIHHSLIKHLYGYGIYCNLIDWTVPYTQKEHEYFKRCYRFVSTMPDAVAHLRAHQWSLDRIVAVAHCERDLTLAIGNSGVGMFDQLHAFGVVNEHLVATCKKLGINRTPTVVRVGIDTEHFYAPPPNNLKIVGYAGTKTFTLSNGEDCKRGYLAEAVVNEVGLTLQDHEYHHHLAMPGYYHDVDAVVVSSNYETVGLPALEAAAAGRLVLSTEVGYFDGSYGIKCRIDEQGFKEDATAALRHFMQNPEEFRTACVDYRKVVQDRHDWTVCAADWAAIFK